MDVNNIAFDHKISAHCENGVSSNLMDFYGLKLSEPMVFGIGAGLFFTFLPFIKLNGAPVTSFRPMPGWIFSRVSKSLGVKIKTQKFSRSPEKAMNELNTKLSQGIPVGMVVGVYHLTYFPAPLRFHFNAHNIVAYGRKNGSYLVSDPTMENPKWISAEDLKRVRFAKGTYKPNGKMYYVTDVPKDYDLSKAVKKSIKHAAMMMTKAPGPFVGISGIKLLSKSIRKWPAKHNKKKAARYLGSVIRMQEEIGTGGAGFRFLYAAFLQESAELLKSQELLQLSVKMTEVGDLWREFAINAARVVKNRPQNNESYDSVADNLLIIASLEKTIFEQLYKLKL
ncbi:MAG: BtrH N-terminal domain-containing protein [Bacteroidales bacterium]|nr:BtrH N-terminal domain-containing protein [Bacteroidales bacterium]